MAHIVTTARRESTAACVVFVDTGKTAAAAAPIYSARDGPDISQVYFVFLLSIGVS
jgi:hypothetical protein